MYCLALLRSVKKLGKQHALYFLIKKCSDYLAEEIEEHSNSFLLIGLKSIKSLD